MNTDCKKTYDRLPDAELDVMRVLWNSSEAMKTAQILEVINQEKNWSMSTLQALLSRLENRGFVKSQKKMRLRYYSAIAKEEGYRLNETQNFLKRLYNNSFKSMVATLIDGDVIRETELEEIAEMVRKAGKRYD